MNSSISTALIPIDRCFADGEQLALAGFLAGYRGSTREAYALDLRQFAVWCAMHERRIFEVHRVDIECFGRELEARGRARATIARRLCTIAGFYRYAEEEGLISHSPAIHVRRPRLDYESHATGLDRNELGALLVAAGLSSATDHALVSLLALNGLRVSEALGADIDTLDLERGHRTLTVTRKGGKVVTMPLAPRVARTLDLAIGERLEGPIFVDSAGDRLDRHAAGRIVRRMARQAGITKRVGPHTLRHAFITAALDAGVPLRDVQEAASHADPAHHHALRPRAPIPGSPRHLHRRHVRRRRLALTLTDPEFGRRNPSALEPRIRHSVLPNVQTIGKPLRTDGADAAPKWSSVRLPASSTVLDGRPNMATKGKTQLLITFVASPDKVDKIDSLVASHGAWLAKTHPREGSKALLSYNFSKGPELANPLDPGSEATGNTRYVLNEIYESPAGIENHWQESQQSWGDFAAMVEVIGSCNPQTLHGGEIAESLW